MSGTPFDDRPHLSDDDVGLRVPPQSVASEHAVLGSLLINNDAWDRAADLLLDTDFYRPEHRAIYGVLGRLINSGKPADVVTVLDALGDAAAEVGGLSYLNALAQSVPSAANIRRYAEIVAEKARQRALIAAADQAGEVAGEEGDFEEKVERIASLFSMLRQARQRSKPSLVADLLGERVDHYNALAEGNVTPGVSTGLRDLDNALGGGMLAGKVIVMAARPGVGKTSKAQSMLMHAAKQGHVGLILSQEMERTELVDRGIANLGSIGYGRLITGKMSEPEWVRLGPALDAFAELPLHIDDQSSLTLHDIRAKARSIKGLRLLCIDYVQLCAAPKDAPRGITRNTVIEELSRGLKALAKDLGITVLLLSQLNREVERRSSPEPTMADLRDSGAIEQDADVIVFMWRAKRFQAHDVIACSVPKNRQAKPGTRYALEFQGHYQRWLDSNDDVSGAAPMFDEGFKA